jgi:hypothetical protein
MLRDEAAVLTAQAAHHNNRARTLHHIAHYQSNLVTDSLDSNAHIDRLFAIKVPPREKHIPRRCLIKRDPA